MTPSRFLILAVLVPILALSWVLLAVLEPNRGSPFGHVLIGFLIGTLFGQATLASAWTALGPGPLQWRLPLSLVWIAMIALSFLVNTAINQHGAEIEVGSIVGSCLVGQWLFAQIPLWGLAVGFGIRLRHRDDQSAPTPRDRQFGIRQVMIVTAIVAILLGLGRSIVVAWIGRFLGNDWSGPVFIAFLAAAGIVVTLPLLVAALLPRHASLATTAVLILIAVATWWELPLMQNFVRRGGSFTLDLALINAFQAAWVLAVVCAVRLCGYGIGAPRGQNPFAINTQPFAVGKAPAAKTTATD